MDKSFLFLVKGMSAKLVFMLLNSKTLLRINLLKPIAKPGRQLFMRHVTGVPYCQIKEGGVILVI